ncbi:MAG: PQQ-dependent sugar dehydrogenase [Blastocatellia bacterium]|nr:PQQ-dependent sugar dehydrogenase [Blastocatellia bacterium]
MSYKKLLVVFVISLLLMLVVTFNLSTNAEVEQTDFNIRLQQIASGLSSPLYVTHAGDESGRLFIVEQTGKVRIFRNGTLLTDPFLDISSLISFGGERGLLSVAFHPHYSSNRRFFVNYTRAGDGATIIAEYRASTDNPNRAEPDGRVVLMIPQPFSNHNGGQLQFGKDGFLYIGMGDGGGAGDPIRAGQDIENLLGKMLRIDIDSGSPYSSPRDNPFFGATPGRDEIFALGFRNPFRFSFDRKTGELYAADVGQNRREEIDIVVRGGNYGWNRMEGSLCFSPMSNCDRTGLTLPIAEYGRDLGCSVSGGYVYRGKLLPEIDGVYFFGDFCTGRIFGFKDRTFREMLKTELNISSFGEDEDGEVYVVNLAGTVSRIVAPAPRCLLTCPEDVEVADTDGDGSEVVSFDLPKSLGECNTLSFSRASGTTFPVGTTPITVNSSTGNATCSFNVIVRPANFCSLTCPKDIEVIDEDGNGSEVVNFTDPKLIGNCGSISYSTSSGSVFPIGVTRVVANSSVNQGTCIFNVTVRPKPDTTAPTVRIISPNGGEKVRKGEAFTINWISSDNTSLRGHDILLSIDGGATYPIKIAEGLSGSSQSFVFTVPNDQEKTKAAKVRVIAIDGSGNRGQDDSDTSFRIRKRN